MSEELCHDLRSREIWKIVDLAGGTQDRVDPQIRDRSISGPMQNESPGNMALWGASNSPNGAL